MSRQKKKLIKLLSMPSDYTFEELDSLLKLLGYVEIGNNSGSSIKYYHPETKDIINFHKPHPGNIVKRYVLEQIIEKLELKNGELRKED